MATGTDQKLSSPADGQADWDSSLNANNVILTRGYHTTGRAGTAIDTLDVLWMNSGGFMFRYDPNSYDARPHFLAYTAAASGDSIQVLEHGVVRSFSVVPGRFYYVDPASPGRMTSVSSPPWHPVGIGVEAGGFFFRTTPHVSPLGGAAGDVLTKTSSKDWDLKWAAAGSIAAGNGLPTGGSSGDILWKANTTTDFLTVWSPAPAGSGGGIAKDAYSPPTAASFTVVSGTNGVQPTRSDVTSTGLLLTFNGSPGAGDNIRLVMKAMATESYDIVARMRGGFFSYRHTGFGLCLVQSGGKVTTFGKGNHTISGIAYGAAIKYVEWNTHVNSFAAEPLAVPLLSDPEWLRISVDTVNINAYMGIDGVNWQLAWSRARATFQESISHAGFFMVVNRTDTINYINTPDNHMNVGVLYYTGP